MTSDYMVQGLKSLFVLTFWHFLSLYKEVVWCIFIQIFHHFVHKYAEMHPISDDSSPAFCTIYVRKSGNDEPKSGVSPSDGWLFICGWMAIGVVHKWPSVSTPMAIELQTNGHRTTDGQCVGPKSHALLAFEGWNSRVDYLRFESFDFVYTL